MVRSIIALIVAVSAVKTQIEPQECLEPSDFTGENYNGKVKMSESGRRCLKWGKEWPVDFKRYCRKIEGKDRPGCFVKSQRKRTFQYCHIPTCPSRSIFWTIPSKILVVYTEESVPTYYHGNRQPVIVDNKG